MITATTVRTWELDRTPDLIDLVGAARDNGHEVLLIERPMPDAVSVAALGKAFDLVAAKGGVALEDARRPGRGLRDGRGPAGGRVTPVAQGLRFARKPGRRRRLRVPAGPRPGRTLVRLSGLAAPGSRACGDAGPRSHVRDRDVRGRRGSARAECDGLRAPAARRLEVTAVRNPMAWTAAVESAAARLRAGDAAKVVLAREVLARGDGVVSAAMVARSLRAAYPSCFTYLMTGADGTAFAGASPELLVRRSGVACVLAADGRIRRARRDRRRGRNGSRASSRKARRMQWSIAWCPSSSSKRWGRLRDP